MKKFISLFLGLIMLVSLGVPAFAEVDTDTGELYEIFENFNFGDWGGLTTLETDNFILTTNYHSQNELVAGTQYFSINVKTKGDNDMEIKRIEARVSKYGEEYGHILVNSGNKLEGEVKSGDIVHVDEVNSKEFEYYGGEEVINFDMIKVYYKYNHEHIWDKGICSVCNVKGCEIGELEHDWNNGVCSVCECECEHTYDDKGVCTNCKMECPHTHITQICDDCGTKIENDPHTASTISEGNMTIIVGVACLAVGLVGGLLIGKKKKVTE